MDPEAKDLVWSCTRLAKEIGSYLSQRDLEIINNVCRAHPFALFARAAYREHFILILNGEKRASYCIQKRLDKNFKGLPFLPCKRVWFQASHAPQKAFMKREDLCRAVTRLYCSPLHFWPSWNPNPFPSLQILGFCLSVNEMQYYDNNMQKSKQACNQGQFQKFLDQVKDLRGLKEFRLFSTEIPCGLSGPLVWPGHLTTVLLSFVRLDLDALESLPETLEELYLESSKLLLGGRTPFPVFARFGQLRVLVLTYGSSIHPDIPRDLPLSLENLTLDLIHKGTDPIRAFMEQGFPQGLKTLEILIEYKDSTLREPCPFDFDPVPLPRTLKRVSVSGYDKACGSWLVRQGYYHSWLKKTFDDDWYQKYLEDEVLDSVTCLFEDPEYDSFGFWPGTLEISSE